MELNCRENNHPDEDDDHTENIERTVRQQHDPKDLREEGRSSSSQSSNCHNETGPAIIIKKFVKDAQYP